MPDKGMLQSPVQDVRTCNSRADTSEDEWSTELQRPLLKWPRCDEMEQQRQWRRMMS